MPKKKPRPIMVLLDVLGRRWTLRILWELRAAPMTFRALRAACDDVSPSVLNTRTAELREIGILTQGDAGYELTAEGKKLGKLLLPLNTWADRNLS